MPKNILLVIIATFLLFTACKKDEGIGGKATITGKIFQQNYDNGGNLVSGFYVPEIRVYISYGNTNYYDNDVRTGPDGNYEFRGLREGKYSVFTYSQQSPLCGICPDLVVKKEITIDTKKQIAEVADIVIDKY